MKMTSYSPQWSLYGRLSGFSRQSLAASQVARIVGNCFRNPAQMRSRSPLLARVCVREYRVSDAASTQATTGGLAAPILMCESLGTITTITGPVASHHTIRVRRFPRPLPFTLRANLELTFLRGVRSPDGPSFAVSPPRNEFNAINRHRRHGSSSPILLLGDAGRFTR